MNHSASALISCEWLNRHLADINLVLFDASYFLPRQRRRAAEEFNKQHIPGALFFDIDRIANLTSDLAHTVPTTLQFSKLISTLGVSNDSRVVVYDNNGFFASARAWWLFRLFGHEQVKILDGGMQRWLHLNYETSSQVSQPESKIFRATLQPELLFSLPQICAAIEGQGCLILDARSPDSFKGHRPLSDNNLQAGHMPGSINICYKNLVNPDDHTFISNQAVNTLLQEYNLDLSKKLITTCGSGVSAAMLNLALYQVGLKKVALYDGSWAEYGRHRGTAKVTG